MSVPEDHERSVGSRRDESRPGSARAATNTEIDNTPTVQLGVEVPEPEAESRHAGADASSGCLLGARYLLEEEIGRGGSSIVFRARDMDSLPAREGSGRLVAIKLLRLEHCGSARARTRFRREFQQLNGLSHPGIVRVWDLDCEAGTLFISMELIAGQTVQNWMRTPRGLNEVLQLTESCCEALAHAHSKGVVHGDLKPTNVLLTQEGAAKLIDFGSALSISSDGSSRPDPGAAATLIYASPQVLAGKRAEPRDDVFSLACLIYAVLTGGRHPFGGHPSLEDGRAKSAPTYLHAIPPNVFDVLKRALSAEPARRPPSAQEFLRAVTAAASVDAAAGAKEGGSVVSPHHDKAPVRGAGQGRSVDGRLRSGVPQVPRRAWLTGSLIVLLVAPVGGTLSLRAGAQRPVPPAAALLPVIVAPAAASSIPQSPPVAAVPQPARVGPAVSGSVSFETPTVEASAAQSLVAITVKRSRSSSGAATFMWRVMRGSAEPGVDYQEGKPEVARFVEGQTVRTLFIPLLNTTGMAGHRPRSFTVVLERSAGGLALGRFARATVTIAPLPEVPGWQRSGVYQVRADQR